MEVVPTATMGALAARRLWINGLVMIMRSLCMVWVLMLSPFTGRKVPAPTWSVVRRRGWPLLWSEPRRESVRCSPAVGAATDPSWRA